MRCVSRWQTDPGTPTDPADPIGAIRAAEGRDRRRDEDAQSLTVVLMGVSGCGKSTVMARMVERFAWPSAEADHFHPAANVAKMAAGRPLTDEDRWPWLRTLAAWIRDREERGENAVMTCSALKRPYRDFLREGHPSVRFVHLTVNPDVLTRRMAQRHGHYMPPSLLASQLATFEAIQPDEPGCVLSGELPPDRIVDEIAARFGVTRSPWPSQTDAT